MYLLASFMGCSKSFGDAIHSEIMCKLKSLIKYTHMYIVYIYNHILQCVLGYNVDFASLSYMSAMNKSVKTTESMYSNQHACQL